MFNTTTLAARQVGERKRPDDDPVHLLAVSESRRGVTTELSANVGMVLRHVGVLNGDLIRFAVRR